MHLKKKKLTLFFLKEGFIRAPAAEGGARTNRFPPCLLRSLGSWFLIWGEGWGVSRGQAGGVAQVFCPPLRWYCVLVPAFAPGSLEVAVGFWSLYLLSSICPNCTCSVIFSLIFSPCILLLEERCVQVQALCTSAKGPRPQPVSLLPRLYTLILKE